MNNVRAITKVKRGKRNDARPEMPTHDDLRVIIAATPDRARPLMLTALLAGLRGSELRGLTWNDVDLKRGEIHVAAGSTGSTRSERRSRKPARARSQSARYC
jgi:integrase